MKTKHPIGTLFFYLGFGFLYIPIFLIIVYSFNQSGALHWEGFSLKWYGLLFQDESFLSGAIISFQIALTSATLSTILGTLCATLSTKKHNPHKFLGFMATMPLVIPEIITGLSLLLFFVGCQNIFGFPQRGFWTVVVAHTILGAAYGTAIVRTQLLDLDPSLSEAALDLGARPYGVFFLIKLPIIFPSLITSWLIAFILSFDDVVLASFTSGPGNSTLPLVIFSSLKMGSNPKLNALATCIVAMVSLVMILTGFFIYKKSIPKKHFGSS